MSMFGALCAFYFAVVCALGEEAFASWSEIQTLKDLEDGPTPFEDADLGAPFPNEKTFDGALTKGLRDDFDGFDDNFKGLDTTSDGFKGLPQNLGQSSSHFESSSSAVECTGNHCHKQMSDKRDAVNCEGNNCHEVDKETDCADGKCKKSKKSINGPPSTNHKQAKLPGLHNDFTELNNNLKGLQQNPGQSRNIPARPLTAFGDNLGAFKGFDDSFKGFDNSFKGLPGQSSSHFESSSSAVVCTGNHCHKQMSVKHDAVNCEGNNCHEVDKETDCTDGKCEKSKKSINKGNAAHD